jgi:hypothetical protein
MTTTKGVPASELSDEELERQGTHAHATRNTVFLYGSAEQFRHHTERMLELEQEYLRRHPKRTWQGTHVTDDGSSFPWSEAERWARLRRAFRTFAEQMDTMLAEVAEAAPPPEDPVGRPEEFLARFAAAPDGRLHRLEAHQAAREARLDPIRVADLYKQDPPLLAADGQYRCLTDAGRQFLTRAGQVAGA